MRVLLVNPKSAFSFWNLSLLTKLTGSKTLFPPLGLITVAALLPDQWEFRLVDQNTRNLTEDDWDWSELVAVSGMIVHREDVLAVVREAEKRGKTTVVGGPYASSQPKEVLAAGAGYVVRGEGENTIPLFLSALREGRKNIVIETQIKPEMAVSPLPRFDLLELYDYTAMGIQASRGCPHDCEFCDVVNLFGRKIRYKQASQITEELETLHRLGWVGVVFVSDDNFIGNKKEARIILQDMVAWSKSKGEPFSFWTQTSVDLGQDIEMINLLTTANFSDVFIGIESPNEDVLSITGKLHNIRKPLVQSLENIKRNGLSITASFIIGLDGEKEGAGRQISRFVQENDIPKVMLSPLRILPNTRLWNRLAQEGRLLDSPVTGGLAGGRLNFVPTRPPGEIWEEFVRAWEDIYAPSRYLARAYNYFLAMRPTRNAMGMKDEWTSDEVPGHAKPPLRRRIYEEVLAPLRLLWWQGILSSSRLQFWRQLRGMLKNNPSRIHQYLRTCAFGENMMRLTAEIRKRVDRALGQPDQ